MTQPKINSESFHSLGIAPKLLEILQQHRLTTPTPIQLKSIPTSIEGKDLVGIAQTGTGKTLAFGIPMLQRLVSHGGKALVLVPTRELAAQVNDSLQNLCRKLNVRTAVIIGGESKQVQMRALRSSPQLLIATPGRLIDYIKTRVVDLRAIKILVLDEADLMFDMGFAPQIAEIFKALPVERQTMLFSATMPPAIMQVIAKYMKLPVRIEVAPAGTPAEKVTQEVIVINREARFDQLIKILNQYKGSVLIFSRTKHGARNLTRKLSNQKFTVAEIHSGKSLNQRTAALKGFKLGRFRVLVATDIAARGIDVKDIELVINFDLPSSSEDYVHRIGRTARAGKNGQAISFASPSEMKAVRKIEQIIKKAIPQTHINKPQFEAQSRTQNSNFQQNKRPHSNHHKPRRYYHNRRGN